jgi:hypothetical protein
MSFTNEVFIAKVREMRAMQKQYFKTRDRAALESSKQFEREVDGMLAKMADPQGGLL